MGELCNFAHVFTMIRLKASYIATTTKMRRAIAITLITISAQNTDVIYQTRHSTVVSEIVQVAETCTMAISANLLASKVTFDQATRNVRLLLRMVLVATAMGRVVLEP